MGNYHSGELKEKNIDLKVLDLSRRLTPENYLKHVRGAHLEGCLESVPCDIIYYDTISMYEEVNLSFNNISFVPEEFSLRVPHLQLLNISHNNLTSLPHSFQFLIHLRVLDLSFNRIDTFPEAVISLHKLETLNVANNSIHDIPSSIANLKELLRLNVSCNNLRTLPEELLDCSNLRIVVTIGNNLIHPPQEICSQGSSQTLEYLSQNRIVSSLKSKPSPAVIQRVFTRVRGQQVIASVTNPESASQEYKQAQSTSRSNKKKCPLMTPEGGTSLSPDQLTERILGLVYGACIGDAFGLNMEGMTRDECLFFYYKEPLNLHDRVPDLLRSYFPPRDWSSNTDVMLLTLDSLMRWGGVVDELELVSQILQWVVHGFSEIDPFPGHALSPLLQQAINSECFAGHPHSSAELLYHKIAAEQNRGVNLQVNLSDNSCLPAAVILGLPNFYKEEEVGMNAERICRATHFSPIAISSCIFVAVLVSYLLQGKFHESKANFSSLLEEIKSAAVRNLTDVEAQETFHSIFNGNGNRKAPSNDVTVTLQYIQESIKDAKDSNFTTIVSKFLYLGGKGISAHCCVLGGVLGAYYGFSDIPTEWLKQLPKDNLSWLNGKLNSLLDMFGLP